MMSNYYRIFFICTTIAVGNVMAYITRLPCLRYGHFKRLTNQYFQGSVGVTRSEADATNCSVACVTTDHCLFANFHSESGACELFDTIDGGSVIQSAGWEFLTTNYSREERLEGSVCELNDPCRVEQHCSDSCNTTEGYLCGGCPTWKNHYLYGQAFSDKRLLLRSVNLDGSVGDPVIDTVWGNYYWAQFPLMHSCTFYIPLYNSEQGYYTMTFNKIQGTTEETKIATFYSEEKVHLVYYTNEHGAMFLFRCEMKGDLFMSTFEDPTTFTKHQFQPEVRHMFTYKVYERKPYKSYLFVHIVDGKTEKYSIYDLLPEGKLGTETENSILPRVYSSMCSFVVHGRNYILGHHKNVKEWVIRELLPGGKLSVDTDSGTWTKEYEELVTYSIGKRTFFYAWNPTYAFVRELLADGKLGQLVMEEINPYPVPMRTPYYTV